MKTQANKQFYKRIALVFSLFMMIIWALLGTGASLAWFNDTSNEVINIFHIADFDLLVEQRLENIGWDEIDSGQSVFNDQALYEPGYVQVVYLRITNNGDSAFNFKTAVCVADSRFSFYNSILAVLP